MFNVPLNT